MKIFESAILKFSEKILEPKAKIVDGHQPLTNLWLR